MHAICSGCFIAEIQESSDITYRIFDYNRPGLDGKPRELHTALAKDAIDFKVYPSYRTQWTESPDTENILADSKWFVTSEYCLTKPFYRDLRGVDSFVAVICIEGEGLLENNQAEVPLHPGETVLIPACSASATFKPLGDRLRLLTSYVR